MTEANDESQAPKGLTSDDVKGVVASAVAGAVQGIKDDIQAAVKAALPQAPETPDLVSPLVDEMRAGFDKIGGLIRGPLVADPGNSSVPGTDQPPGTGASPPVPASGEVAPTPSQAPPVQETPRSLWRRLL